MSGDGNFKWYWGRGQEPDYMYGAEDTRDAILQVARRESEGGGFTICQADKSVPGFSFFDADQVLEQYEEYNVDCWSEDGPEIDVTPAVKRELELALTAAFEAWVKKNDAGGYAWAFGTQRNTEYFPPAECRP